jgi:endonuclease YncB( thermonuclease family)
MKALILIAMLLSQAAIADDPVVREARLSSLIDGDTFWVFADSGRFKVRLAGIDAPETRGQKCETERALGDMAARQTAALLLVAKRITLIGDPAKRDKYGRWLGIVEADGKDLAAALIESGAAVPWSGKRHDWCK